MTICSRTNAAVYCAIAIGVGARGGGLFGIGRPNAVPYELRHTTNSLLAELGVDAETRAAICGHSEGVNKKVYPTFGLHVKRAAMDKLADLFPDLDSIPQLPETGSDTVSGAA